MESEFLGPFCAFMSSVTWVLGSATYSRLAHTQSPFAINFLRALIALPLFVLATFLSSGGWTAGWEAYSQIRQTNVSWLFVSMFASYGFGDVCFLMSTRSLGVPGALAIASAYPLWTALAGFLVQGEAMSGFQAAGLVLTIGGVIVVILSAPRPPEGKKVSDTLAGGADAFFHSRRMGVLLAVITSGMWALNGLAVARGAQGLATPVGSTVRMVIALGLSAGLGRVFAPKAKLRMNYSVVSKYLWIFALEAFGGSFFFMYGLSHSPLVIGSTLSSLAPVLAVPVTWMLRLEKVSLWRTVGIFLVVSGLWLLLGVLG